MAGRTDFITAARWDDVWTIWYTLVDDAYQTLEQHYGAWRRSGPQPLFSDSEAITVGLSIDTWFGGHEALGLSFLRQYHPTLFPHLPPDGWFNQRRTVLAVLIDQVRRVITWHAGLLVADDPVRVTDNAPITLATYTRGGENRTLSGSEYFGIASSKGAKLFGLRLHVTTTVGQVVDDWLLAPASLHDSTPMNAVFEHAHDLLVLGHGAYHSPALKPVLEERHRVKVLAPRAGIVARSSRGRRPSVAGSGAFVARLRRLLAYCRQCFILNSPMRVPFAV